MPEEQEKKVGLGDLIAAFLQLNELVEKLDSVEQKYKARIAMLRIAEYIDEKDRIINDLRTNEN